MKIRKNVNSPLINLLENTFRMQTIAMIKNYMITIKVIKSLEGNGILRQMNKLHQ